MECNRCGKWLTVNQWDLSIEGETLCDDCTDEYMTKDKDDDHGN